MINYAIYRLMSQSAKEEFKLRNFRISYKSFRRSQSAKEEFKLEQEKLFEEEEKLVTICQRGI